MPALDVIRAADTRELVAASDLSAGYSGVPAIEGVSMAITRGMRVGVLGPNGGGKTTLFRALLGEVAGPRRQRRSWTAGAASSPRPSARDSITR